MLHFFWKIFADNKEDNPKGCPRRRAVIEEGEYTGSPIQSNAASMDEGFDEQPEGQQDTDGKGGAGEDAPGIILVPFAEFPV